MTPTGREIFPLGSHFSPFFVEREMTNAQLVIVLGTVFAAFVIMLMVFKGIVWQSRLLVIVFVLSP